MADEEPNWLALSTQDEKPTQVLPGHHWEKIPSGWQQVEDDADTTFGKSKISDELSYLKDWPAKRPAAVESAFQPESVTAESVAPTRSVTVEPPVKSAPTVTIDDFGDDSSDISFANEKAKSTVKIPNRPGQQEVVTPAMIRAAGAADLREYLNMKKGLIDRRSASLVNKKAGVPSENFSSTKLYPKVGAVKQYAKGGKINLAACGVSTHTPSKKKANW